MPLSPSVRRTIALGLGLVTAAQLSRAGAKSGGAYVVHRARRAFADAERREQLDDAFELKTAEQIAATVGNMKGAMPKIGQMVSSIDAGLPPHVREALAQLQSDAPPWAPPRTGGASPRSCGRSATAPRRPRSARPRPPGWRDR